MIITKSDQKKLEALNNKHVIKAVEDAVKLCKPKKVSVITDSEEDISYVRQLALENGEENELNMKGHTYHFDGFFDQARDKEHTKYLLTGEENFSLDINSIERKNGLKEVLSYLEGSMKGKEMLVRFFSLGPNKSKFSLLAMQITDSSYVAHSEDILYRKGYEDFKELNGSKDFFYFLHSAGKLKNGVSTNIDKRRIYIDLKEEQVFSVNNQYAGNSLGLKKLAFRLAIKKAVNEGWLAEHMFITGVNGPKNRKSYFTGAFPSGCGKTSTAMLSGNTVVGDDIAYLKEIDGKVKAVNVENGIFGIINDVNPKDDKEIFKALTNPKELIFSNTLIKNGKPYWMGMGNKLPEEGINFSGKWYKGKTDDKGNKINPSHKNARYTVRLNNLENCDENYDNPEGVKIDGIIYGGRDSYTTVPVAETLSWVHGVIQGASLESETTAQTLGSEGVRKHNPMATLDFISVNIGDYLENHLEFGRKVKELPTIFTVNYFLRNEKTGKFINDILDKKVWLQWAEGRVHEDFEAIKTPIGFIPRYEDLVYLFKKFLDKDYNKNEYIEQFSIRVNNYLAKLERIEQKYENIETIPQKFIDEMKKQRERLEKAKLKYGKEVISPFKL